jgi:hypothetical protein
VAEIVFLYNFLCVVNHVRHVNSNDFRGTCNETLSE